MKTTISIVFALTALAFSSFKVLGATAKTVTAEKDSAEVLWPTNLWTVNSADIFSALSLGDQTTNKTAAGWRTALGFDAAAPGALGTNMVAAANAAAARIMIGLDAASPGVFGTNWLTVADALAARIALGLDSASPGLVGTNLLTAATEIAARTILGLGEQTTNTTAAAWRAALDLDVGSPGTVGTNVLTQTTPAGLRSIAGAPADTYGTMTYPLLDRGTNRWFSSPSSIGSIEMMGIAGGLKRIFGLNLMVDSLPWPTIYETNGTPATNTSVTDASLLNYATAKEYYGSPGAFGKQMVGTSTAASGRGLLELDVATPGALGTNLLTTATAAAGRGLLGFDVGAPGAFGTNFLLSATPVAARTLLGSDVTYYNQQSLFRTRTKVALARNHSAGGVGLSTNEAVTLRVACIGDSWFEKYAVVTNIAWDFVKLGFPCMGAAICGAGNKVTVFPPSDSANDYYMSSSARPDLIYCENSIGTRRLTGFNMVGGVGVNLAASGTVSTQIFNVLEQPKAGGLYVCWNTYINGGKMGVSTNGGAEIQEIDTASGTSYVANWTQITGTYPTAPFTVEVYGKTTGTANIVWLAGIEHYNSNTNGVLVWKEGISHAKATDDLINPSVSQWNNVNTHIDPDLVILEFGQNDRGTVGMTASTFISAISTAVSRLRTTKPMVDIILVAQPDVQTSGYYLSQSDYVASLENFCRTNTGVGGLALLNLQPLFGNVVTNYIKNGYYPVFDGGAHPTTKSGALISSAIMQMLTN